MSFLPGARGRFRRGVSGVSYRVERFAKPMCLKFLFPRETNGFRKGASGTSFRAVRRAESVYLAYRFSLAAMFSSLTLTMSGART